MRTRRALELLGPTERAILQRLWEAGPQTVRQVHRHFQASDPNVAYTSILTPMRELHAKGLVSRTRDSSRHVYQALPRAEVLAAVFEKMLAELGATAADRAQVVEALRHG